MELFKAILTAGGFSFLLSFASIFARLRGKVTFFGCPLCTGFHLGYLSYFAFHGLALSWDALFCAVASSLLGYTITVSAELISEHLDG